MTVVLSATAPEQNEVSAFRDAMRHLVGGVSIITAGTGEARTGLTVSSAVSLSVSPPTMLICVNRNASAWPVINAERHFCVNVLGSGHAPIADRFAGRGGAEGAERYKGARWRRFVTGALGLEDALAVIDCAVEEIIERHSHGIIIGGVQAIHVAGGTEALIYGQGRYRPVSLS
jgi:3-hydroxy-9,10-secoandrosta-1,3,5(10)-triene-9,17-dione monooxygenase reductase component